MRFHPGKVEEWKRLSEQAMEIVRTKDRGTLQYEIFFNADETEAIVYERYRDRCSREAGQQSPRCPLLAIGFHL